MLLVAWPDSVGAELTDLYRIGLQLNSHAGSERLLGFEPAFELGKTILLLTPTGDAVVEVSEGLLQRVGVGVQQPCVLFLQLGETSTQFGEGNNGMTDAPPLFDLFQAPIEDETTGVRLHDELVNIGVLYWKLDANVQGQTPFWFSMTYLIRLYAADFLFEKVTM